MRPGLSAHRDWFAALLFSDDDLCSVEYTSTELIVSRRGEAAMKIAILGTGKVAHALGAGWRKAGHEVVLGARDASVADPDFAVTGLQEALAAGDVVVNAITGAVALAAITALCTSAVGADA